MCEWISVDERLPESMPDRWSEDVIALCDNGCIFRLAIYGEYWQRSTAFVESGADRVTHWMPIPKQNLINDADKRPQNQAEHVHICSGCGCLGWTASCDKCIPY